MNTRFKEGMIPWNKGTHGIMPTPWNKGTKGILKAWNKGLNKDSDERIRKYSGDKSPNKRPEVRLKLSLSKKGKPVPALIGNHNGFKKGYIPQNKGIRNPERTKENRRIYTINHKEEKKEYDRLYRIRIHDKKINNDRLYYLNNKEKIKKQIKEHQEIPEVKKRTQERNKKYRERTKEQKQKYDKKYSAHKYKNDVNYRIKSTLRARVNIAINSGGGKKYKHTFELIGCSFDFLKEYLEKQFKPGMCWDNHGLHGWHIDHIIPCYEFDLTNPEEQRKCFHYSNMQPLWATENLKKWRKYDGL
jgi:hypothetical protein